MSDVQQGLQKKLANLQTEYDLWTEKLRLIRRSLARETDPSVKFKLLNDRKEAQSKWEQLAVEIEHAENQLVSISNNTRKELASPGTPAPAHPQNQDFSHRQNSSKTAAYHSCFIAYAHQDEALAQRLHTDLQTCGVHCWFAPHDMKIGAKIRPTIDEAIQKQDKLLLLLSTGSISSSWVEAEVEEAFEQEKHAQREMLFPIRLDDSIMQSSQAWAANLRRTRHIGDFTNWMEHQAYQQAFERLLRDLKKADEISNEKSHQTPAKDGEKQQEPRSIAQISSRKEVERVPVQPSSNGSSQKYSSRARLLLGLPLAVLILLLGVFAPMLTSLAQSVTGRFAGNPRIANISPTAQTTTMLPPTPQLTPTFTAGVNSGKDNTTPSPVQSPLLPSPTPLPNPLHSPDIHFSTLSNSAGGTVNISCSNNEQMLSGGYDGPIGPFDMGVTGSYPAGSKTWTVTAGDGPFTGYVLCVPILNLPAVSIIRGNLIPIVSSSTSATATCPSGTSIVGGGYEMTGTYPGKAFVNKPANNGWLVTSDGNDVSAQDGLYAAYAVCISQSVGQISLITNAITGPGFTAIPGTAACGSNQSLLGGGYDGSEVSAGPKGDILFNKPQSTTQWGVSMISNYGQDPSSFDIFAICA